MTAKERMRHVRSVMVRNGITNKRAAQEAGVSLIMIYYVLSGQRRGRRIRNVIANLCNVPVTELWPDESELPQAA
jgi:lambda repressor-like predicted transcriptional regulator